MVFRNFRFQFVLRLVLLNATILLVIWLFAKTQNYITAFTLSAAALLQVAWLIEYAERSNTMFVRFLNAIRYDDFSQTHSPQGLGRSFDALNQAFNKVMRKFQEIRTEKEAQYHYLKTILDHIDIGLIVYDQAGKIEVINPASCRLLQVEVSESLQELPENLQEMLQNPQNSQKRELFKLHQEDRILQLLLRKTAITIRGRTFFIVSIQDIQSELEEKEMEAWQNLIRVLTHEIINSVTPIASLATTINEDLEYHLQNIANHTQTTNEEKVVCLPLEAFEESSQEVHYAIKTIQKRSQGLIRFVQDFRSLTKIPLPNLETLALKAFLEPIIYLMKEDMKQNNIQFQLEINPPELEIIADAQLIEQVIINLLKNAIQALEGINDKKIRLFAYKNNLGKTQIALQDNGAGISPEALKNIFIPFFTTKKTGSGIGLSLSRQVMRLHGGNVSVQSELGKGSTFLLNFA